MRIPDGVVGRSNGVAIDESRRSEETGRKGMEAVTLLLEEQPPSPNLCGQIKARIEAKLVELGRDTDEFGFEAIQQYSRGDNQWPGDIAAWRDAGGSHISVVTMGANLTTVDGHIEAIKRWRAVYNSVR